MSSESTPLNDIASSFMTKENAQAAGTFAKDKFQELRNQVQDGDVSIRLAALLGGFLLIISSVLQIPGQFFKFHFVGALVAFYTLILGVVVLMLEGKGQIPFFPSKLGEIVMKYALILRYVSGRGSLYFVAGTLQLSQMNLTGLIAGGFMTAVGVVYIWVGHSAQKKLTALKNQAIPSDMLKARFHQADSSNTGKLDMESFKTLALTLGLNLNRREVETAFMMLDTDSSGTIGYPEFETWWNTVESLSPFQQLLV